MSTTRIFMANLSFGMALFLATGVLAASPKCRKPPAPGIKDSGVVKNPNVSVVVKIGPVATPDTFIRVRRGERRRQFFTRWQFEEERNRYFCYYYFRPNPRVLDYKKQIVFYYPGSPKQSNQYMCFYNIEKGKYWGRCTTKNHPKHNPEIMKWHFASKKGWDKQLTPGSPAIPGSNDGAGMISPPDPPR